MFHALGAQICVAWQDQILSKEFPILSNSIKQHQMKFKNFQELQIGRLSGRCASTMNRIHAMGDRLG
jgi:hypothetical protein